MKKPTGWKRLSEQEVNKLKVSVAHFDYIWAWKKGDIIVGAGKYSYPGGCPGGWGYNIFSWKGDENTKWGDEVYEQGTAIWLAYREMHRREGKPYGYEPKPRYIVYCAKCDWEKSYERIIRSKRRFHLHPVTEPEKFTCPICKTPRTLRVAKAGEAREVIPALEVLKDLFR